MAEATADLRKCLGEVESKLHTKEQVCSLATQDSDCLAKELADQAEKHKAEIRQLKDGKALLKAEFRTERLD